MTTSPPPTHPRAVRAVHWLTVLALAAAVPLGFFAEDAEAADRIVALRAHAILGAAIVALTVARLVLARRGPRPAPLPMPAWRRAILRIDHVLLYGLLLALGLTGVGTVVTAEIGPALLGSGAAATVPSGLLPPRIHAALALALLFAIGVHVAGVLAYQAFEGDALGRMIGRPLRRRRDATVGGAARTRGRS